MRSRFPLFYLFLLLPLMMSCGPRVPETFSTSKELPVIYPDYTNVTVPVNIAPLTFEADVAADELVASFKAGTEEVVCGGDKVQPSMDEWKRLVDAALNNQPPARLCRFVPSGQRRYSSTARRGTNGRRPERGKSKSTDPTVFSFER